MKKWVSLDTAVTPDGKILSLSEQDGTWLIRVDGVPLMSTRKYGSEQKIAELACAHAKEIRGARALIGGLGFGFTLKAALAELAADATVVVAEILAAVIAWNRNPSFRLAACALDDPRVTVLREDVGDVIGRSRGEFDSIIMDVDNGPAALSSEGNHRLYDLAGLQMAQSALRPGGCLAVWSAAPDPAFAKLLAAAGFEVSVPRCRAHGDSGGWHTIFIGRRK